MAPKRKENILNHGKSSRMGAYSWIYPEYYLLGLYISGDYKTDVEDTPCEDSRTTQTVTDEQRPCSRRFDRASSPFKFQ